MVSVHVKHHIYLADPCALTHCPVGTDTLEMALEVVTLGVVQAGLLLPLTLVHVHCAVRSCPSRGALAPVTPCEKQGQHCPQYVSPTYEDIKPHVIKDSIIVPNMTARHTRTSSPTSSRTATTESRRDQEEEGELDSQQSPGLGEIKSREVELGRKITRSFLLWCNGHCLCDSAPHSS